MRTHRISYSVVLAAIIGVLSFASITFAQDRAPAAKTSTDVKETPRTADGHPDFNGYWNYNVPGVPDYRTDLGKSLVRAGDGSLFFNFGAEAASNHAREGNAAGTGQEFSGDQLQILTGLRGLVVQGQQYAGRRGDHNSPPYKPEYMAKVKELAAHDSGGSNVADPEFDCKPDGVPRASIAGITGGIQILQAPQAIGILYEESPGPFYRLIYMDGRPHPKDLDTSYMGHSIGHWEGDTLVVDVAGLNDETWLGGGQSIGSLTSIHSDKEHVIERWTREGDDLVYEATVEDPVMFTQPWVITPRRTRLAPKGDYIQPEMCGVNDDRAHIPRNVVETPNK